MSNVPRYKQALTQVKQAREGIRNGIAAAVTQRDQAANIRYETLPGRAVKDERSQSTQAFGGGKQRSVRPAVNSQQVRAARNGFSMSQPIGKPFRSTAVPASRPERLFKEEAHELEPPIATASSATAMPALAPRSETPIQTKYGPGIRYSGTEYLTTITTSTAGAPARGEVLFSVPISPQIIPDTRLGLACNMYTRFIFSKCKFYYMPTAPATTPGSLMMFCDYDPSQNPSYSIGEGALRYAFTHSASESSVWQRQSCEVTDRVYAEMLYCDPDEELRWSTQGCFWVLSSGAIGANLELGKIVMEYDIDFAIADYRGTINSPTSGLFEFNVSAVPSGSHMTYSVTPALPGGTYFMRIENFTLGSAVNVASNLNAEQQGTTGFLFGKGVGCFGVMNSSGGYVPIFTPDLYMNTAPSNHAIRNNTGAAIASGSHKFMAQVYGLSKITVN